MTIVFMAPPSHMIAATAPSRRARKRDAAADSVNVEVDAGVTVTQ
jgi:hypothetical protein